MTKNKLLNTCTVFTIYCTAQDVTSTNISGYIP